MSRKEHKVEANQGELFQRRGGKINAEVTDTRHKLAKRTLQLVYQQRALNKRHGLVALIDGQSA